MAAISSTTPTVSPTPSTTAAATSATASSSSSSTSGSSMLADSIKVHNFTDAFMDSLVHFQIIQLASTYFVWIGESKPSMANLSIGMVTPLDTLPSVTTPLGSTGGFGHDLAERLAQRYKTVVMISYNLASENIMEHWVEERLMREFKSLLSPSTSSTTAAAAAAATTGGFQSTIRARPKAPASLDDGPRVLGL